MPHAMALRGWVHSVAHVLLQQMVTGILTELSYIACPQLVLSQSPYLAGQK